MTVEQSGSPARPSIWALLVGIDRYQALNPLRGCVNDVQAMRVCLMNRYDVPDPQIRVLVNEEATRDAILGQFQEFLIENPEVRPGDQILFQFSGHGSVMPAGPEEAEPDGLNETIVPHDSRVGGVYDIPDKTLAALLDMLAAAKGDQITVILDSCHSGSGTRRPEDPSTPRVRRVPADERVPPTELDASLRAQARVASRAIGPSGWVIADLPYVLLAGCRDREESNEHEGKVEDAAVWHGALTYFTMRILQELPQGSTWADLHEQVAPLVNARYPYQMPQCEGRRERLILGDVEARRDPFIAVRSVDPSGEAVTLAAGLVHGLRPGTELALYPPEVRTRAELPPTPMATVQVTSVAATTARAQLQSQPSQPMPERARAVVTRHVYSGLRQTVRLEAEDGTQATVAAVDRLRDEIQRAASDGGPSPYLRLEDDTSALVDLRVRVREGRYRIDDANGEPLVDPAEAAEQEEQPGDNAAVAARRALESVVRFRTILELRNEDASSRLAGRVKLRLRRYVEGPDGPRAEELPSGTAEPGGELTLYVDPEHDERNLYVVDVVNESDVDIYLHVFTLSPDFSITALYPTQGIQEAVRPNRGQEPYPIGIQRGTTPLRFWLPPGWDASRDYLKAIVTTTETDLRLLEQHGLQVPPPTRRDGSRAAGRTPLVQELLEAVAYGQRTRFAGPRATSFGEDWTVALLTINAVRQYQATRLDPEQQRVPLSDELTMVKPPGFTGTATVTTFGVATRGAGGDPDLRPPPGLDRFPDRFQLFGREGTRGLGSSGLVVALDVDEASRRLVTKERPLRLELPRTRGGDAADLLAVAFDGEDYLLVGYGTDDGDAVDIVSLPPPAVSDRAEPGVPTVRGIGRTIRLFVYKKLGRHIADIGLRRAEIHDGKVTYTDVRPDQFQPGQSVALFVHGFLSDSRWMVEAPARFLQAAVRSYEHLLTWDYETFGTNVRDSGEQLALALRRQCGLAADDQLTVDVYAHSMGSLVTRCMIELSGGHELIDRAVLAGPPNHGSTLASTGRGLVFLVTGLLNHAALVPVLGAANWLVKQLFEQGAGLADLAVDAEVLADLNALEEPSSTPYLVLAGENLVDAAERGRLSRLAGKLLDRGLDAIFGEQNDIAVGLSSMRGLRGGAYPRLEVAELPCDHFHYYVIPEGQQAIQQWAT